MSNIYAVDVLGFDGVDRCAYENGRYAFQADNDNEARKEAFDYAFQAKSFENGDNVYFFPDYDMTTTHVEIKLFKADTTGVLEEIDFASFDPLDEALDFSLEFVWSNVRIDLSEYDESYGGYRKRVLEVQNGEKTK